MTRDVVTVSPRTPLKEAAELLARHRISGLPVVDEGTIVGVLSEADIVARSTGSRESHGLIREFLGGRDRRIGREHGGHPAAGHGDHGRPDRAVDQRGSLDGELDRHVNPAAGSARRGDPVSPRRPPRRR